MADLRNDIGAIAISLGANFYYGRRHEVNADGDNFTYPAIILVEPDSGNLRRSDTVGAFRKVNDTFIQFLEKSPEISQGANYRYTDIQAMVELAVQFLYKVDASDIWDDLNQDNPWALQVDLYDANTCGIELNLGKLSNLFPTPC